MNGKRRVRASVVVAVLSAGVGIAITPNEASAASTIGFRLSNFSAVIGNICVVPGRSEDSEKQCSGKMATGKSKVFQVKYGDPAGLNGWMCYAEMPKAHQGATTFVGTDFFSRQNVKECVLHGTTFNPKLDTK